MKKCSSILYLLVLLIGAYMILSFNGAIPPLLSGIAFVLIGIAGSKKMKK